MSSDAMTPGDPLGSGEALHLCVDMQRLFGAGSPWEIPWLDRVLDPCARLVAHCPERTVFTRFIPPRHGDDLPGTWRDYYAKWSALTRDRLPPGFLDLAPPLGRFAPPARIVDKGVYSPWLEGRLDALLSGSPVDTLILSGGETDVCVLATALGAVDRGYRVILARGALCSASDATHDAILRVLGERYSMQVAVVDVDDILAGWVIPR